jgi:DNA invertase Pin-like site-specific DNA recombinase
MSDDFASGSDCETGLAATARTWLTRSELRKQGVQFKNLTDAIGTATASGRFFFHVMASLAEMERELPIERPRAGLEVARQLGRKGGR